MPIYTYKCTAEVCGHEEDVLLSTSEAKDPNFKVECFAFPHPKPVYKKRVLSLPAQHQMGGHDGKLRTAANIEKRNRDHHKSRRGQESAREGFHNATKRIGF